MKDNTRNINEVIADIKDYMAMKTELEAQIDALKAEAEKYMDENELEEYVTPCGTKVTWRESIANRFASTEFKKIHEDLYKAFCKQTTYKRFTING